MTRNGMDVMMSACSARRTNETFFKWFFLLGWDVGEVGEVGSRRIVECGMWNVRGEQFPVLDSPFLSFPLPPPSPTYIYCKHMYEANIRRGKRGKTVEARYYSMYVLVVFPPSYP